MASAKKPRSEAQKRADAKYEAKRRGTRHIGWVWITYPESIDPDWLETLTNWGVQIFISPLHDRDKNADGTPKKEHNHYLMLASNPIPYEPAREICDSIGGVMPPKNPAPKAPKPWAQDVRIAARYLCHLDNPEKAQYDPQDVTCINCTLEDYYAIISSAADDDDVLDEIFDYIDEYTVISFSAFVRYCRQERPEWRRLVYHKYAAVITRYIKSVYWEETPRPDTVEEIRQSLQAEAEEYAMNTIDSAMEQAVRLDRAKRVDETGSKHE